MRSRFDDVIDRIRSRPGGPVIVESTIAPHWLLQGDYGDLPLVIAPRRDWLHGTEHSVRDLARICASADAAALDVAVDILRRISPRLAISTDPVAACTAKCLENSVWYILFSYINSAVDNLRGVDAAEVLRLVRTNWRTPFEFDPAFQVGGSCLPLAAHALQAMPGAHLGMVDAADRENERLVASVLRRVLAPPRPNRVAVLGLSYRPGVKIDANSAGTRIIAALLAVGVDVCAHDPLYTGEETQLRTGARPIDPFETLAGIECVVICTRHACYTNGTLVDAIRFAPRLHRIIDCISLDDSTAGALPPTVEHLSFGSTEW